jgi:hypothetical protein
MKIHQAVSVQLRLQFRLLGSLSRQRPSSELATDEKRRAYILFDRLRKMLSIKAMPANILLREYPTTPDRKHTITVGEAAFELTSNDGSYLWIVSHVSLIDGKDEEPAITLEEHAEDGQLLLRHMYIVKDEIVRRSSFRYDLGEPDMSHYSDIDKMKMIAYLAFHGNSDGHPDQFSSRSDFDNIENEATNAMLESEFGFNDQPVSEDEILKLREILRSAMSVPSMSTLA